MLFPNARIVGPDGDATGFLLHRFAYVSLTRRKRISRSIYAHFSGVNLVCGEPQTKKNRFGRPQLRRRQEEALRFLIPRLDAAVRAQVERHLGTPPKRD